MKRKFSIRRMLTIIIPIILFVMLAILVKLGMTLNLENWAYYGITTIMSEKLTIALRVITEFGDKFIIILLCLALVILPKTRIKFGIPASTSVIVATSLNVILKHVFSRERPNILRLVQESSYSFPSGHAMASSALYFILLLLIIKFIKNKKIKITTCIILSTITVLVGISRIYLGVHYLFDVVGGWLLGCMVATATYYIFINSKEYKIEKE